MRAWDLAFGSRLLRRLSCMARVVALSLATPFDVPSPPLLPAFCLPVALRLDLTLVFALAPTSTPTPYGKPAPMLVFGCHCRKGACACSYTEGFMAALYGKPCTDVPALCKTEESAEAEILEALTWGTAL